MSCAYGASVAYGDWFVFTSWRWMSCAYGASVAYGDYRRCAKVENNEEFIYY